MQAAIAQTHKKSRQQAGLTHNNGGKANFMQTQTFHRRNLSNLINMSEEEEVPDHLLISRGGPPRRTLEQIEHGSNHNEAQSEEDFNEMMYGQGVNEEAGYADEADSANEMMNS